MNQRSAVLVQASEQPSNSDAQGCAARSNLVWLTTHTLLEVKTLPPTRQQSARARSLNACTIRLLGRGAVNAALQDPAIADSPASSTVGPPALHERYICRTWRYNRHATHLPYRTPCLHYKSKPFSYLFYSCRSDKAQHHRIHCHRDPRPAARSQTANPYPAGFDKKYIMEVPVARTGAY